MVVSNQLVSWASYQGVKYTLRIHVWYIYLHLVDFYGKYRYIYQTHGSYGIVINPTYNFVTN